MTKGITFDNIIRMTYSTTVTSKGQMTIPASFRKQLGVKPGERVLIKMHGGKVVIEKDSWRENLRRVQKENLAVMKQRGIKPLINEELDDAINAAAEQAAMDRHTVRSDK